MKLLLLWSLRDLRARWIQVTVIALVIAIGTGAYAGMSSLTRWRRISTDDGYATFNLHDIRVRLAEGAALDRGELAEAIRTAGGDEVVAVSERLLVPAQLDIVNGENEVIVAATVYGLDLEAGPEVDRLHLDRGRLPDPSSGGVEVLLERNFALFNDLPDEGPVTFSGALEGRFTGHALVPDLFIPLPDDGRFSFGSGDFGFAFASLETAGLLAGEPGSVNDAVVQLVEGTDREAFRERLEGALEPALGGTGYEVRTREEGASYRVNDRDIEGDQQTYNIIALFILGGATVAAFNLTARIVEQQRREIGIAMTLGLPPLRIAVRPLLVGAEIAFLGVLFGLIVGGIIAAALAAALSSLAPLPRWQTPLQVDIFVQAALLGFIIPFAASAWPVIRAVRVAPVEAIRAGYRAARGWGWAPWLQGRRLPGSTFAQMPVRNIVRAPRRTLLTAIGVAAAVAILIAFVGMIDSLLATMDRADEAGSTGSEERMEVAMAAFLPADGADMTAVVSSPLVSDAAATLEVPGTLFAPGDGEEIAGLVELLDLTGRWAPDLKGGDPGSGADGIYLSEAAARDLGLGRGDTVVFRHPTLLPGGLVALDDTELTVLGTHAHPFRFIAYMEPSKAGLLGLEGLANHAVLEPAPGVSKADVKRGLSAIEGVAFVEGAKEQTDAVRDSISEFVGIFRVIQGAVLLLAALIAFNSASINIDERAREHATMFAYGVRVRTVMWMAMFENLLLGLLATAMGLLGGWLLLRWLMESRMRELIPDIWMPPVIAPSTLVIAVGLGVAAVALAPLLTLRRLGRMDVAGALKTLE